MPYNYRLPRSLRNAGWKVKIRDKETLEPPHVTIILKTRQWRLNLRSKQFMNKTPNPSDVPEELVNLLMEEEHWNTLCNKWDHMYPSNPVSGDEE